MGTACIPEDSDDTDMDVIFQNISCLAADTIDELEGRCRVRSARYEQGEECILAQRAICHARHEADENDEEDEIGLLAEKSSIEALKALKISATSKSQILSVQTGLLSKRTV